MNQLRNHILGKDRSIEGNIHWIIFGFAKTEGYVDSIAPVHNVYFNNNNIVYEDGRILIEYKNIPNNIKSLENRADFTTGILIGGHYSSTSTIEATVDEEFSQQYMQDIVINSNNSKSLIMRFNADFTNILKVQNGQHYDFKAIVRTENIMLELPFRIR